jgi:precorrin-2/cobalt-factor-2 C20-methyltransferase
MTGTLYGVGAGPGDPELITVKALRILQLVPVVYVPVARAGAASFARSIVEAYVDPTRQQVVELAFAMRDDREARADRWEENARTIAEKLRLGLDAAFVTEGDPMLYSTFGHIRGALAQQMPEAPVVVVPGISSVFAAAAAAQQALADGGERVAILPTSYEGDDLGATLQAFDTVVLLKVASCFDRTLDTLEELNMADRAVFVSRCGTADERVVRDVRSLRGQRLDYFSLLIVRRDG